MWSNSPGDLYPVDIKYPAVAILVCLRRVSAVTRMMTVAGSESQGPSIGEFRSIFTTSGETGQLEVVLFTLILIVCLQTKRTTASSLE